MFGSGDWTAPNTATMKLLADRVYGVWTPQTSEVVMLGGSIKVCIQLTRSVRESSARYIPNPGDEAHWIGYTCVCSWLSHVTKSSAVDVFRHFSLEFCTVLNCYPNDLVNGVALGQRGTYTEVGPCVPYSPRLFFDFFGFDVMHAASVLTFPPCDSRGKPVKESRLTDRLFKCCCCEKPAPASHFPLRNVYYDYFTNVHLFYELLAYLVLEGKTPMCDACSDLVGSVQVCGDNPIMQYTHPHPQFSSTYDRLFECPNCHTHKGAFAFSPRSNDATETNLFLSHIKERMRTGKQPVCDSCMNRLTTRIHFTAADIDVQVGIPSSQLLRNYHLPTTSSTAELIK